MATGIRLITWKDGRITMEKTAKETATLEDIMEIAECEVFGGYADYAQVWVDNNMYAEYEA